MIASSGAHPKPSRVAGRDFVSWSQLSTFRQCQLRYKFRYLDKVEPEFVASSLLLGSSIHGAIEFHHRKLLEFDQPATPDEMLGAFWEEWKARSDSSPKVRFGSKEDVNTVGRLAESMLTTFLADECSVSNGSVVCIEESLSGKLIAERPNFLGIVDLAYLADDRLVVRDYKTSRSRWNQAMAVGSSGQLGLYCELAKALAPECRIEAEFVVITKTKSPTIETFAASVNQSQLDRTLLVAERTMDAIDAGNFYPHRSQMNCHSCPYRSACAAWDG